MKRTARRRRLTDPSPILLGVIGAVMAIGFVGAASAPVDFDLTLFVKTGAESAATRAAIEALLGPVVLAPELGHDGQSFFLLAQDPLLLEPGRYTRTMDNPAYWARRMLYPTIGGLFGLLSANGVVLGLVLANVLAMGLGTYFTADLARATGRSGWLGLAFAANIGMLYELLVDGGGLLAWGLAVGGLAFVTRRRPGWAAALFSASVLARELMLLVVAGAAWVEKQKGQSAMRVLLPPIITLGAWTAWVRVRLGHLGTSAAGFDWPLRGLAQAVPRWEALDYLVAGALLVSTVVVIRSWVRDHDPIAAGVLGFLLLGLFLSVPIWGRFSDFARVLAPVLTVAIVAAAPRRVES